VESLHGELCVYEWTTKRVHALNPAAARVWEMCDGVTTVDEMTAAVQRDLHVSGAASIVQHALAQFDRAGLLEPGTLHIIAPLVSRRALLRRIGVAAAIPVVTSIVAPTPLAAQSGTSMTFPWTNGTQTFTVPAGIVALLVDVQGASGAGLAPSALGGNGGRVQATLSVTPGEVLTIMVGGAGILSGQGGFNGGGAAGTNGIYGGGGMSHIARGAGILVIAGGGGGGGFQTAPGGAGGGLTGAAGTTNCGGGGGGGTPVAGGAGGAAGSGGTAGTAGVQFIGGTGGNGSTGGGGGGGGLWGGGGGGGCGSASGGSGGGGSSFTDATVTAVVHTQGFHNGPGVITVTW